MNQLILTSTRQRKGPENKNNIQHCPCHLWGWNEFWS